MQKIHINDVGRLSRILQMTPTICTTSGHCLPCLELGLLADSGAIPPCWCHHTLHTTIVHHTVNTTMPPWCTILMCAGAMHQRMLWCSIVCHAAMDVKHSSKLVLHSFPRNNGFTGRQSLENRVRRKEGGEEGQRCAVYCRAETLALALLWS